MPKGCHNNHARGEKSGKWKGGIMYDHDYKRIQNASHHRSTKGYVLEYILTAEKALGKPLPVGAVIHHTDGHKGKIDPDGIVICQDQSYHALIESRLRALRSCGHVSWRKCCFCHEWDDPIKLLIRKNYRPKGGQKTRACHQVCERDYQRTRKLRKAA